MDRAASRWIWSRRSIRASESCQLASFRVSLMRLRSFVGRGPADRLPTLFCGGDAGGERVEGLGRRPAVPPARARRMDGASGFVESILRISKVTSGSTFDRGAPPARPGVEVAIVAFERALSCQ